MSASERKDGGEAGEAVGGSEQACGMWQVVAEPAARVGGSGVEDVVECIEADGDAGGAGEAVCRRKHSRGVENQQGMGKIASAENADAHQQAAERRRQGFEPKQKRARSLRRSGALPTEKPKGRHRNQSRQKRPEKNFAERVAG